MMFELIILIEPDFLMFHFIFAIVGQITRLSLVYKMANVKSPPIFSARNARQINLIVSAAAVKSRL